MLNVFEQVIFDLGMKKKAYTTEVKVILDS